MLGGMRRWVLRGSVSILMAGASLAASLVPADVRAQGLDVRPWLGVAMGPDTSAPGVAVGHVIRGSPADKAGVREGDRILRLGGTAVLRPSDVLRIVGGHAPGDTLDIAFARAGREQAVKVALAAFPPRDEMIRMDLVGAFAPAWRDVQPASGSFPASIGSLRGRVVLLDFWATWCAPCRVAIPKLDALQARYGAQGLSVLGVTADEAADVALFAQRMGMRYGIGVDTHGRTSRTYGVVSLPTLVVIDKRGVVRDVAVGYDSGGDARLETEVQSLLAEPAPAN
jgi:thiol-disulfide isomerase/thioredoxin